MEVGGGGRGLGWYMSNKLRSADDRLQNSFEQTRDDLEGYSQGGVGGGSVVFVKSRIGLSQSI